MPRKPKPVTHEERKYTASEVGELLVASLKAMGLPVQQPIPAEPEPTEEGGE